MQEKSSSLLDNYFDQDVSLLWLIQKISANFPLIFSLDMTQRIPTFVKFPSFLALTNKQKLSENKKEIEKLILG